MQKVDIVVPWYQEEVYGLVKSMDAEMDKKIIDLALNEGVSMSTIYKENNQFHIVLDRHELAMLAEHLMVIAQEGHHNPELNPVFNTIVTGAKNAGVELYSDEYKAFKKFIRSDSEFVKEGII